MKCPSSKFGRMRGSKRSPRSSITDVRTNVLPALTWTVGSTCRLMTREPFWNLWRNGCVSVRSPVRSSNGIRWVQTTETDSSWYRSMNLVTWLK